MEQRTEQERRHYHRAGAIAAAIYNVNRDAQKHPQAITPADIFPGILESAPLVAEIEASDEELEAMFLMVNAMPSNGGQD